MSSDSVEVKQEAMDVDDTKITAAAGAASADDSKDAVKNDEGPTTEEVDDEDLPDVSDALFVYSPV